MEEVYSLLFRNMTATYILFIWFVGYLMGLTTLLFNYPYVVRDFIKGESRANEKRIRSEKPNNEKMFDMRRVGHDQDY